MVGKVLLHKFLIRVCRVGLSKVLLEYHVLVALEKFPLIYWQPFGLFPLLKTKKKKYNFDFHVQISYQNIIKNDILQNFFQRRL